jgi:HSP90 family molecular chaperone
MSLKVNVTDNGIGMTPDEMTQNLVRTDPPL